MLKHPTLERLEALRLVGMHKALQEQLQNPEIDRLDFLERLGLLVDREVTEREDRRLQRRLSAAKLRQSASLEDPDYRRGRGLDRAVIARLATGEWIRRRYNVLITGATGVGKSYLACALAHKACLLGHSAFYVRLSQLLEQIKQARGDGRYGKLTRRLLKMDVLVLDDWGLVSLKAEQQRELLELIEERYQRRSTVVSSQVPVGRWHELMSDPTLADAILDRLIHNAYRIDLDGDSMRKHYANLQESAE